VSTKRVLVTGASGFIGRPLVAALLRAGYAVRAVTRRPISFPNSVDVVIVPDFKNSVDWTPILQGIDIVVHLAGLTHADSRHSDFAEYDQVNWLTTLQLARVAKDVGVDRFVLISSVRAQIGPSAAQIANERDEPHPTDDYGRSKLAAEMAVRSIGLPFTILRPVVVYGPHSKGNIKRLVQLGSLPLPLPFKGFTNQRSLLGIDNLIAAILFVLNNPATAGETFLVADPMPLTLPEIFTMLRKAQGRKPRLVYAPATFIQLALRLLGLTHLWERISESLVVDTSKLESFGWRPTVNTYEGFVAMMRAEGGKTSE
jgi:nucleoside-diphosphate-sugar epimerase